ncbi:TPA: hypothetical protein L4R86_000346 [Pseudomonas aeruginosa]|uniref:hypothetical protein n=1 Tax=Pseudomonas aeruginosa TaxID=287 RepID=UPI001A25F231|nr:hypothetical protein [Pseudomonas aeruginosa]MBH3820598.1 hypothetical protein [Pseudomonas aeruginosa]MDE9747886.1 hypothetical protein [Pseudomonas aeruginosa]HBO3166663.1 hypothetical protein [Pseudomonas aeruginosa]
MDETQMDSNRKMTESPWEDSLILAFRDMQWIRKIQTSARKPIKHLAQPPALMVKLDGNAESRAGDVLAGYNEHYFLLEFKSSRSRFNTEQGKSVHARLAAATPYSAEGRELLDLSTRGHLLAYPEVKRGGGKPTKDILPIHNIDLMCVPYCLLVQDTSSQNLTQATLKLDDVFYGEGNGLSREEMADYLNQLVTAAVDSGDDGAPFKAVIATPDGLFWPTGRLSDFERFVASAGLPIKPQPSTPQQMLAETLQLVDGGYQGGESSRRSGPRNR